MKKVLVAVDRSGASDQALDFAIGLGRGSELRVSNVAEDLRPLALSELDLGTIRELSRKAAEAQLCVGHRHHRQATQTKEGVV